MKKRLKADGVIAIAGLLIAVVFPKAFFRRDIPGDLFNGMIKIFGIILILSGQVLRVSARGYKSEHSQEGRILIQDGPYGLVRNPMYLGVFLIGLGIALILFKWWFTLLIVAVIIIRYMLLISEEDKKLSQVFGQAHASYKRRVPCLAPSLKTILDKRISEYLPLKWTWLKKEIGTILAILLSTLLIGSYTK